MNVAPLLRHAESSPALRATLEGILCRPAAPPWPPARDFDAEREAILAKFQDRKDAASDDLERESIEAECRNAREMLSSELDKALAAKGHHQTGAEQWSAPAETPTAAEPLRGLRHLAKVALLGRDRILEMARRPIAFVWQDIAVESTIVVIAGGVGEGKTTLLFLVLVARMGLSPVELLGRVVKPAPVGQVVVLVEGEHGAISTSRKLEKSCALVGVDDAALDRVIIIARKSVRIGSLEWLDVVKMIAAGLVSDVALDTLARVAGGDANDEQEQVAAFDSIAQAIEAAPAGVVKPIFWVNAHLKKNGNGSLEDVSGSAQRTGQADSVIFVRGERVDGEIVSSTVSYQKLREEPDDYPKPVTFAIVKDPDGGRRLVIAGAKTVDDRPIEARILDLVTVAPRTKTAIATALGRSDSDVDAALTNLFGTRSIQTTTIRINGRQFKAFQPRSEHPTEHPTP